MRSPDRGVLRFPEGPVLHDFQLAGSAEDVAKEAEIPYVPLEAHQGIARAQGFLVAHTWFDNIWVVHSAQPGFVGRLQAHGAWLALDWARLEPVAAIGCFFVAPIPTS